MRRISKRAAFWLYVMAVLLLSVCLVIIMPKFGPALVLCYGFTVLSWTVCLYGQLALSDVSQKDFIYRIPTARISWIYALLATMAAVLLYFFFRVRAVIVLVQGILLVLTVGRLGAVRLGSHHGQAVEVKTERRVGFQREMRAQISTIQSLVFRISGECKEDIEEELDQIADLVRYGDPVSDDRLRTLEQQIAGQIRQLRKRVETEGLDGEDHTAEILVLTSVIKQQLLERDQQIRLMKSH